MKRGLLRSQLPFGERVDRNWRGEEDALDEVMRRSQLPFGERVDRNQAVVGVVSGAAIMGGSQLPFGKRVDCNFL